METAKAKARREREGFYAKYIGGRVLDIGCGTDPVIPWCNKWDFSLGNTDAATLEGVERESYDTVYSSHCLEHLHYPHEAVRRWFQVVKPGGHLIIVVPERDLYEKKKLLPSNWNRDHKLMFTLDRDEPPNTYGLVPLITNALRFEPYRFVYAKVCSDGHTVTDPSQHSNGEYSVEAVIRKL